MISRSKLTGIVVLSVIALIAIALLWPEQRSSSSALSRVYTKQSSGHEISQPKSPVSEIMERGVLRVASRNAPTTYYHGASGAEGFEFDLVKDFSDYLGVDLEIVLYDSVAEILEAVEDGAVDLAAAGITKTVAREQRFLFGPEYQEIEQQVVCNRQQPAPKSIADLIGRDLNVIAGSSYVERLKMLTKEHPGLSWTEHQQVSTEELIYSAAQGEIECVVSDSNIVRLNQRFFPDVRQALTLSDKQPLAWAMHPQTTDLKQVIADWFLQYQELGLLQSLDQHYYQSVPVFDFVDTRAFHRRVDSRLPSYQPFFEQSAQQNELAWLLLAAQSYQESHWNPKAKSATGVRGMMMLTLPTAKQVGVKSRLDAEQSIGGGARYMASILGRLPEEIPQKDRIWYGLAAYNVGMGHLYDARNLAESLGKDPNSWDDMQQVLPLLAKKKYYSKLRYGYARGYEPVEYVKRIRHYRDILTIKVFPEKVTFKPNTVKPVLTDIQEQGAADKGSVDVIPEAANVSE
ncbi:MAG: membrane-bound lytic murein transglycosylase MltF [Motiliproteus sp.]